jgi:hypothetical protein
VHTLQTATIKHDNNMLLHSWMQVLGSPAETATIVLTFCLLRSGRTADQNRSTALVALITACLQSQLELFNERGVLTLDCLNPIN